MTNQAVSEETAMESPSSPTRPTISRGRWMIHLLLITAYILVIGLLGLGRNGTNTAMLSKSTSGLLWVCSLELIVFGLVFMLACFVSRATRDDLLIRWQGKIRPILQGAGYSVAIRLALALMVIAVSIVLVAGHIVTPASLEGFFSANRPGVEKIIDVPAMRNDPVYFWLTLTFVSFVVAGLREELWRSAFLAGMRALWPQHFGSRNGKVLAVIICSIIFGLGHSAMGPIAVCFAGLIGVGLGLIMIFHDSIWPAVIAHGFFDATSMAMLPWAMEQITKIPK